MPNIGELVALLRADISDLDKKLDKAERHTKKTSKRMSKALSSIPWKAMGVAAGAASLAIVYAMNKAVKAANVQEAAEKRLGAVIKSTGQAAGFNLEEMKRMADEMQRVTTIGDEVTLSGMAMLSTFKKIQGEGFKRTMMVAADMSDVMQTDLKSSLVMIGKAMNDPIANLSAMSRAGVQFTKDQKDMIKKMWELGNVAEAQALILKEIESQFGGAAKAARETFGGAAKAAKNAWGDLVEEIGYAITKSESWIQMQHDLEKGFIDAIKWMKANQEEIDAWSDVVIEAIHNVKDALIIATKPLKIWAEIWQTLGWIASGQKTLMPQFQPPEIPPPPTKPWSQIEAEGMGGADTGMQTQLDANYELTENDKARYLELELTHLNYLAQLRENHVEQMTVLGKKQAEAEVNATKYSQEQKYAFYAAAAGKIAGTFLQISQAGGEQSKRAFKMYQGFAIVQAYMSAAAAYVKTLAEPALPWPGNVAMATIIAGMAAVQIAMIAAARPPSYDMGGISTTPGMYYAGVREAHIPLPSGGNVPVTLSGDSRGQPEVKIILNNPVFQDLETQRRVVGQMIEIGVKEMAPAAVIKNYDDGLGIRDMVRGRK